MFIVVEPHTFRCIRPLLPFTLVRAKHRRMAAAPLTTNLNTVRQPKSLNSKLAFLKACNFFTCGTACCIGRHLEVYLRCYLLAPHCRRLQFGNILRVDALVLIWSAHRTQAKAWDKDGIFAITAVDRATRGLEGLRAFKRSRCRCRCGCWCGCRFRCRRWCRSWCRSRRWGWL